MLDARILAAAHAAATAQPPLGPRIRWLAPLAVAASLSLAVGLAWRLGRPVTPVADAPSAAATMGQLPESRRTEPPNDARDPPLPPTVQPALRSQAVTKPAVDAALAAEQPQATAPPAPPAPPPLPTAPTGAAATGAAATADMGAAPAVTAASSPPMARSVAPMDGARERAAAAGTAQGTQANEAERAAAASSGEPLAHDDGFGEDVPPATVDSPEVRRAWLRRIGELLQEGRVDDARAGLAEFRRRYPDATLPPELRALEL